MKAANVQGGQAAVEVLKQLKAKHLEVRGTEFAPTGKVEELAQGQEGGSCASSAEGPSPEGAGPRRPRRRSLLAPSGGGALAG